MLFRYLRWFAILSIAMFILTAVASTYMLTQLVTITVTYQHEAIRYALWLVWGLMLTPLGIANLHRMWKW